MLQVAHDSASGWQAVSCEDTSEMHNFKAADVLALRIQKVAALFLKPRSFKGKINLNLLIYLSLFVPIKKDKILSS